MFTSMPSLAIANNLLVDVFRAPRPVGHQHGAVHPCLLNGQNPRTVRIFQTVHLLNAHRPSLPTCRRSTLPKALPADVGENELRRPTGSLLYLPKSPPHPNLPIGGFKDQVGIFGNKNTID